MEELFKEIVKVLKAYGLNELPYYACHYIGEGKIRSIKDGKVEYMGQVTEKDLVYFLYCLKKELKNCYIVCFDWADDEIRKEVVLLPCTNFKGCFDTKGTWMHLNYYPETNEFIAYCNIRGSWDKENTAKNMKYINLVKGSMFSL